jgi:hypothetical protein
LIRRAPIPPHALHARYQRDGAYLDCYAADIEYPVSHAAFVEVFYTTWLFKLERWILTWAVNRPSSDAQARELSLGQRATFAAWKEEARAENQLLMCDFLGNTRSWLMVEARGTGTGLYFGSVVTSRRNGRSGRQELGGVFRSLLGFHRLYSRALLAAARSKLRRRLSLLSTR